MAFYAVANGRSIGIFLNWVECSNSVKGYKNAIYKKFDTIEEADAFILLHNKNTGANEFKTGAIEFTPDYYVYTDGGCSNNGKNNAVAGLGIFFGIDDLRNISKKIEGKQTNNTAELTAIIEAYLIIEKDVINGKKIVIVSDSEYAIKCVSSYGEKCSKKQWNLDMPNKELVKTGYNLYKDKSNVTFMHIRAHTNDTDIHSIGNDHADKLASDAIAPI